MVLVDTSVWIRFLKGDEPYATRMDEILGRDEVAGHEMVYGELLIGDSGGRTKLLTSYRLMHHVPTVPHAEVVQFARDRRLLGKGIGWIDAHLLASAIVGSHELWTADVRFAEAAERLSVAYRQHDS